MVNANAQVALHVTGCIYLGVHFLCIASAVKRVTMANLPKSSCLKMGSCSALSVIKSSIQSDVYLLQVEETLSDPHTLHHARVPYLIKLRVRYGTRFSLGIQFKDPVSHTF